MDNSLGCLNVEAYPIGQPLDVSCFMIGKSIGVSCFAIGQPLDVSCFRVCSINSNAYLRVSTDIVWLTPDMIVSGEFDIFSNVSWNIV